jgi:IclR family transcriptional regulator, pca regulon regulatory protein
MPKPRQQAALPDPDAIAKDDPRESPLFVGSTEKAFQVLHAFDGPNRQMPLSMIAKLANLDRSATQRLVHTLEALGYLQRVHNSRDYALTSKLLQFGYNYLRSNELVGKAAPYLLDISRAVGETANLHELDGSDIVYVARFPGKHLINVDIMVGSRLPAVLTASGTAILSHSPKDVVDAILRGPATRPLTAQSLVDPAKLRKRIATARERGFAIITNETVLGDISVASCITDDHGRAIAGISISVPTTRWTVERAENELVKHVQITATTLSGTKFPNYR